jgi:hypothetical protein
MHAILLVMSENDRSPAPKYDNSPRPVLAFTREGTVEFPSLNKAAQAYGVNPKILWYKIRDASTLNEDGYTTFDWAYTEDDLPRGGDDGLVA